jgi:hypothetical protein
MYAPIHVKQNVFLKVSTSRRCFIIAFFTLQLKLQSEILHILMSVVRRLVPCQKICPPPDFSHKLTKKFALDSIVLKKMAALWLNSVPLRRLKKQSLLPELGPSPIVLLELSGPYSGLLSITN